MEVINAVREGEIEAVRQWFRENPDAEPNQLVSLGVTAVHWAASGPSLEILEELLNRLPALKDAKDASDGATPLHWAAQDGRAENIAALLRCGANVFAVDGSGETALHYASMNGHLECARALVRAGGPSLVGITSFDGNSALHLATMNGHVRTIALLLGEGAANPNLPNKVGQSPLSIAQSKREKELLAYFDPEKMVMLEKIANYAEDQLVMEQRLKLLAHEKEVEIRKTMEAFKHIQTLEEQLSAANQRMAELSGTLTIGEQQYNEAQQQVQSLSRELDLKNQKCQILEQQLHLANTNIAQFGLQQQQQMAAPNQAQNFFQNEYAMKKLVSARESLVTLQRMLDDVGMAILDSKGHINTVVDSFHF